MLEMNFLETFPKVAKYVEMNISSDKTCVGVHIWLATSPLLNNGEVANHARVPTKLLLTVFFISYSLATFQMVSCIFVDFSSLTSPPITFKWL